MWPDALFPWTAVALAALAAAISLFLLVKTLVGGQLPGCGPGSSCDSVTTSRWARCWKLPVALPATLLYLCIAALILLDHQGLATGARFRNTLAGLSILAIGAAAWFILVQALVLRRFCLWCMLDHVAGIAAAAIVLRELWPQVQAQTSLTLAIGLAPLVVLIVGQLLIEPKTYEVRKSANAAHVEPPAEPPNEAAAPTQVHTASNEAPASSPPPPPPAPQPAATAPPPRTVALLDGRLKIATTSFPLLGRADAPHVLMDLFDYTCEHCRELHQYLHDARRLFNDKLAILAIPLPMESACNPHIQFTNPRHVSACAYIRLALALWLADPAKFHAYHDWLYAPPRPPGLDHARAHAELLVGKEQFIASLASPAVETHIHSAIALYKFLGAGQIPKLVMNHGVLVGQVPSAQRLTELLQQDVKPKPPPQPEQITTTFIGGFR